MKKLVFASLVCSLLASPVFAKDHDKKMSKEERAKAAEHHEKMAACLRSDKPMKECHDQMHASCGKSEGHSCSMKHGENHEEHHDEKHDDKD